MSTNLKDIPTFCISNIVSYLDVIDLLWATEISKSFAKAIMSHEAEIKKHYGPYLLLKSELAVTLCKMYNPYLDIPGLHTFSGDFYIHIGNHFFIHSLEDDLWHTVYTDTTGLLKPGKTMPIKMYDTTLPVTCIQDVILGDKFTIIKWPGGYAFVNGFVSPNANILSRIAGENSKCAVDASFDAIPLEDRMNASEFYLDLDTGYVIIVVGLVYYVSRFEAVGELFSAYKIHNKLVRGAVINRIRQSMKQLEETMVKEHLEKEMLAKEKMPQKKQLPKKRLQSKRR